MDLYQSRAPQERDSEFVCSSESINHATTRKLLTLQLFYSIEFDNGLAPGTKAGPDQTSNSLESGRDGVADKTQRETIGTHTIEVGPGHNMVMLSCL